MVQYLFLILKIFLKTKKITLTKNNIIELGEKNRLDIDTQKDFNLAKNNKK